MKKNLIRLSCLLLLAFASCKSCKKDVEPSPESKLPPATQTGANTAGCLINGVAWIPNGTGGFMGSGPISAIGGVQDKFIIISFNRNFYDNTVQGDAVEKITLCINNYKTLGERLLNFDTEIYPNSLSPQNYGYYSVRASGAYENRYVTTSMVVGKATITQFHQLRSDGPTSGTFEFDAIDPVTNKIISIKNGRFDIK